ncbi:Elongator complex protein 2 [Bienertia sinuspersici]
MSSCEVERAFIGAGCNRIVNNVSWGASNFIAFGAHNAVAIFCPQKAQILTTLPGHKAAVNCTYWLPTSKFAFRAQHSRQHYLLSGDADGIIMLWEVSLTEGKWRQVLTVSQRHKKGVTCISGIMFSATEAVFASTSSDGTVKVWEIILPVTAGGERKLSYLESLSVGSKPMVALALAELPDNTGHIVLAMGGLDNKIHLYCGERTGKFFRICELKGHSDWIRSLDFSLPISQNEATDFLLLVSSSQDKSIRLWKMVLCETSCNSERKDVIGLASYIEGPIFICGLSTYQISLESLLIGHEDWVYSVQWQPPLASERGGYIQPQSILSASMDKTMMIWKPERTSGIWMNVVTVGELSHCALGFYGGHWGPNGDAILAHGYGGSFHLWKNVGIHSENWQPQKVPSGHYAAVSDIAWARSGKFLLSVSHDQTTRIFAPWLSHMGDRCSWHEIARPQVHGHDFNCVTLIQGKGNHRFVSGADEKVARVFEAPLSFLKTLNCAVAQESGIQEDIQSDVQILGANMSALGLSQKPIYVHAAQETTERTGSEVVDTLETVPEAVPVTLTEPPIEEQLAWHTLWPETHKLYGHGNELFSLCCDHEGKLVASSCKAQTASVAEIWLWQVGSWKAVGRLQSHSLTVTQMKFSHDDCLLLSVSRDRNLSVFSVKRKGVEEISYDLVARQEAHKRIIWACSWNPFGHEFATGSRDKFVKLWSVENKSSIKLLSTLPAFQCSVTALSWLGVNRQTNEGLLAVGLENGLIELWGLSATRTEDGCIAVSGFSANVVARFDPFMCHASAVQRLAWRNSKKEEDCQYIQLASCGADNLPWH